ncbi:DEAD/DEAH box helicase [Fuerstiella marisgermanici]|uniref:ATP-dependent helicase n=1 Tax=Fuerstiella marisgermanici TaxID=1891926 RepID=A0A1P8WG68_9PLAN|nr:DEAD/DEAH box helicase [Fuerstiella marisgermanici]APZ93071.1 ATP-dependent helicase [Fuerstiella marisgermanici]
MGMDAFVDYLEGRFAAQISSHTVMQPTGGDFEPLPEQLDPKLAAALKSKGLTSLYSHQSEAFESIRQGQDTVLVSKTASGKTLSFLLPILHDYITSDAPFGVALLYPTKALSRDQEGTLGGLLQAAGADMRLGTFDGDTPREERNRIQSQADFMITNPDMLHSGILPNHSRKWRTFLSRLKYIVVDEVHTYRGAFGSHVANVMRRLLRVCEMHGSRPTFVCSSATIGNPGEHVEALFNRPFHLINRDGAPRPQRDLYLVNPPVVQSHGHAMYRKGPNSISIPLIREATQQGVRTICFCRSRQQVERLVRAVTDGRPEMKKKVKPYRGGLLPNERRQLERDLAEGRVTTIVSTNALELGIDIGDLDLCLLSGHPGSMSSFWQQAGRVGRRGSRAVIVYAARDTPIDQYFVNHPEFLQRAPIEQAWLNADNPYILLQHLPCAAHEHPLRDTEPAFPEPAYGAALEVLKDDGTLKEYHGNYRYAMRDYPAKGVNLRGMTDYNIEIFCGTEVIGEIDPIGARGELYKDAIYQHLGRRYMSMDLDLEKKLCRVDPVDVDYYTECVWESRVTITELLESQKVGCPGVSQSSHHSPSDEVRGSEIQTTASERPNLADSDSDLADASRPDEGASGSQSAFAPLVTRSDDGYVEENTSRLDFGYINVNRQPKLYKKIRERTLENIGYGPITLDPFIYDTAGFALYPSEHWRTAIEAADKRHIGAGLYGLAYILKRTAPSLCLCDSQNIETDVSLTEVQPGEWRSALYLFDTIEGGVGYAEKIFEVFSEALRLAETIINDCPCLAGCPACVTSLPPGVEDEELQQLLMESNASVECTKSLITALLTGEVVLPEITEFALAEPDAVIPPDVDEEFERLKNRLNKASGILKKKRERIH